MVQLQSRNMGNITLLTSLYLVYFVWAVNGAAVKTCPTTEALPYNLTTKLSLHKESYLAVIEKDLRAKLVMVVEEYLKTVIKSCGSETIKRPEIEFCPELKCIGVLKNIQLTDFFNFRILKSDFNNNTGLWSLHMNYPEIQFFSEFNFTKDFSSFGVRKDIFGNGFLNLKVTDFHFIMQVRLNVTKSGVEFQDFKSQRLIGDIKFNNWNNAWSSSLNKLVNRISSEILLQALEEYQPQIDQLVYRKLFPENHLSNSDIEKGDEMRKTIDCKKLFNGNRKWLVNNFNEYSYKY